MDKIVSGCKFMIINSLAGNNGKVGTASHTIDAPPGYRQAKYQPGPIWVVDIDLSRIHSTTKEPVASSRTVPESLMLRIDDFDAKGSDMQVYAKTLTEITE